jgi:hypothetical protein
MSAALWGNEKGRSWRLRPLVLRFDSLFLLFQIGWGDLAGFCVVATPKYRIRSTASRE